MQPTALINAYASAKLLSILSLSTITLFLDYLSLLSLVLKNFILVLISLSFSILSSK